jgi:Protein of unknown function (DUF3073)
MGRGRAKAKQTKVARELKYSSPQTDFTQLQRELSHADDPIGSRVVDDVADEWVPDDDDWRR